jgi:hypothetical protein
VCLAAWVAEFICRDLPDNKTFHDPISFFVHLFGSMQLGQSLLGLGGSLRTRMTLLVFVFCALRLQSGYWTLSRT